MWKINIGKTDEAISRLAYIDRTSLASHNSLVFADGQGCDNITPTYATWMEPTDMLDVYTSYIKLLNDKEAVDCVARLRLCALNPNVESERWGYGAT
jgi:hypothetical protein